MRLRDPAHGWVTKMNDELSDQEIIDAVRQYEDDQKQHVKGLLAQALELMPEVKKHVERVGRLERAKAYHQGVANGTVEPSDEDKLRMVKEHAIGRYYDRHLRKAAGLTPAADINERTGPDDMEAYAAWAKARKAERQ